MRDNECIKEKYKGTTNWKVTKIMNCLCSGEQVRGGEDMIRSSESLATKDYSASAHSSQAACGVEKKPDTGNIEEAELSLRESGSLNYEEARALLGRYEYQKGNVEAALHVFEGIDVAAVAPKMKITLAMRGEPRRRRSLKYATPPMSIHAVSLLLEAVLLKSKSLQSLGRYKEAAQSCKVILDIVESSLPEGLPENFGANCKLQETLNRAVELLPELWKLSDSPQDAILSFRRALLHNWNLDSNTTAKIQKEFAVFLLYSGGEASPPNLRSQMDSSFVPTNNFEEAILLLMILLRKISLKRIRWDPSVLDHISYALAIVGGLGTLANQLEELIPGIVDKKEKYFTLALCYYGQGDDLSALNLLKKIFIHDNPKCAPALLLASKIYGEKEGSKFAEEGVNISQKAIRAWQGRCEQMVGVANYLFGVSLSDYSRLALTDSERFERQNEALKSLVNATKMTGMSDPKIVYRLCLEYAEQRKLDDAFRHAKWLLNLEAGSNIMVWILLARILSAQKRLTEGETVIDAALDQTGRWDQGELLRTKAKLHIARGQFRNAVDTYTHLLAVLQVQRKSFGSVTKAFQDGRNECQRLELKTWLDLARAYISLAQWHDAEVCLSKSEAISFYSAERWNTIGLLYEAKGLQKEALQAFGNALDLDPMHVPSLVAMASVLRRQGGKSLAVARSLLTDALRLDRMNASAWYDLGLLYKEEGAASAMEAADCFEAACILKETEPIEPFR